MVSGESGASGIGFDTEAGAGAGYPGPEPYLDRTQVCSPEVKLRAGSNFSIAMLTWQRAVGGSSSGLTGVCFPFVGVPMPGIKLTPRGFT